MKFNLTWLLDPLTTRSFHLPTGAKTPAPRLWASYQPLLGYSGRPGIGLLRIQKINSPYHTNFSKSIPSSSVDTQIPLAGKVALATVTSRGKGGTTRTRTRTHRHVRTLPNPEALGPDIEEGAVNRPTYPPLPFPWPGIGLVRIRQINSPYHTNFSKYIPSSSVDTQIPLAGKVALATSSQDFDFD